MYVVVVYKSKSIICVVPDITPRLLTMTTNRFVWFGAVSYIRLCKPSSIHNRPALTSHHVHTILVGGNAQCDRFWGAPPWFSNTWSKQWRWGEVQLITTAAIGLTATQSILSPTRRLIKLRRRWSTFSHIILIYTAEKRHVFSKRCIDCNNVKLRLSITQPQLTKPSTTKP